LALATCAQLPGLDEADQQLRQVLVEQGVMSDVVVWDDPAVDWGTYSTVLIRSTWDYPARDRTFREWAHRVERTSRLINPADVVAWNIDKVYLRDLEERGLPIVPTIWLDPERQLDARAIHTRFPAFGDFVIKPTVSAGSRDTGRYDASKTPSRTLAITHAKNLLGVGRTVMVQRYLKQVDTVGETALVYVDVQFSHAVRKGPLLEGPYRAEDTAGVLYKEETMGIREASPAERDLADRVIAELAGMFPQLDRPLLYARVDLIPDNDGNPLLLEVELIEPSLFFEHAPGSVEHFAHALIARL
jgi:glutathione synthase/RimK-type ligase-like ATP-grasp enzyme